MLSPAVLPRRSSTPFHGLFDDDADIAPMLAVCMRVLNKKANVSTSDAIFAMPYARVDAEANYLYTRLFKMLASIFRLFIDARNRFRNKQRRAVGRHDDLLANQIEEAPPILVEHPLPIEGQGSTAYSDGGEVNASAKHLRASGEHHHAARHY